MCVVVWRCTGHCKCQAPAPKFQWKQQYEMPERWKHMVAKLTAAGVVDLTCGLSHEQSWQRCANCNVKVLREGGQTGMTTQVLHVTNQGQRVQNCVMEGMRGRTVGVARGPALCARWG